MNLITRRAGAEDPLPLVTPAVMWNLRSSTLGSARCSG
jgi:hypothetical protein